MGDVVDRIADGGRAEQHVALAGLDAGTAGAIAIRRPDDEVVEAVAVDVAGRGDRNAGLIAVVLDVAGPVVLALDDEAAVAGRTAARSISAAKPEALPNTT